MESIEFSTTKSSSLKFVPEAEKSSQETIIQSRFGLLIEKHGRETEYFGTRSVTLGHIDPEMLRIPNKYSKVNISSICTEKTLISEYKFKLFSRHIAIVFLQSTEEVKRKVYVRPAKPSNVIERISAHAGSILKVIEQQYGLAESSGY